MNRTDASYSWEMFLNEAIFYNPAFGAVSRDHTVIEYSLRTNLCKVSDFVSDTGSWSSAATSLAQLTGIQSMRYVFPCVRYGAECL